ncbi:secreted protein [methanotrophic bacterial endosymbiont of Bathymodiolus sp.]|nr:secreted protein [methanotrophic bacterial endosymbiont of Bathymodiolus sp.]
MRIYNESVCVESKTLKQAHSWLRNWFSNAAIDKKRPLENRNRGRAKYRCLLPMRIHLLIASFTLLLLFAQSCWAEPESENISEQERAILNHLKHGVDSVSLPVPIDENPISAYSLANWALLIWSCPYYADWS